MASSSVLIEVYYLHTCYILAVYLSWKMPSQSSPWLLIMTTVAAVPQCDNYLHVTLTTLMALAVPLFSEVVIYIYSLPLMLLVMYIADAKWDPGSCCLGWHPGIRKSKAGQCFLKYIWNIFFEIYLSDHLQQKLYGPVCRKCWFLDPRFAESESVGMGPRSIKFWQAFQVIQDFRLKFKNCWARVINLGQWEAQGGMTTGKHGYCSSMVRLASPNWGEGSGYWPLVFLFMWNIYFLFLIVLLISLWLIYKHSSYVRKINLGHMCCNYFLLNFFLFWVSFGFF